MSTATGPILRGERVASLDVLRGLCVAGMILVTDPGTYSAVYAPLRHADWNGTTPTDMIFPTFLFVTGIAMTLSLEARLRGGEASGSLLRRVFRRSVLLFVLGLLLNGFPGYNLHELRLPGVLQRIAVCYLLGSLLYLVARSARALIAGISLFLVGLYWLILTIVPAPGFGAGRLDPIGNVPACVDRHVIGIAHMWKYGTAPSFGVAYDPEGILSTIPALATLLLGTLAGSWIQSSRSEKKKLWTLAACGALLVALGWLLDPLLPINKKLWTSTFVLFSAGVSLLAFAACSWLVDVRKWSGWTAPARVFGTNAITAFVLSNVLTATSDSIEVHGEGGALVSLHQHGYAAGFATWLPPIHASLAYAIAVVALNGLLLYPLYRKKLFLRV
jgi:predicted acyltransferase